MKLIDYPLSGSQMLRSSSLWTRLEKIEPELMEEVIPTFLVSDPFAPSVLCLVQLVLSPDEEPWSTFLKTM